MAVNALVIEAIGKRTLCIALHKARFYSAIYTGARASANLYSLAECAKANSIEPHAYLAHVFERLPLATCLEDYEALLPWNVNLPESL